MTFYDPIHICREIETERERKKERERGSSEPSEAYDQNDNSITSMLLYGNPSFSTELNTNDKV